jgi:TldD protein
MVLRARHANAVTLHTTAKRVSVAANELFPAVRPAVDTAALAQQAVDAARGAGASYADVRVAETQLLRVGLGESALDVAVDLETSFTYGVRALVDGAWAFTHGMRPSADAVAETARNAVATARGYARIAPVKLEIAPAPVVTGEWVMPIELDPFTVPLQDQAALLNAYQEAGNRVRHGIGNARFRWTRETRSFASTDGSMVTQQLWRSVPSLTVVARWGDYDFGSVGVRVPGVSVSSGGYETVARAGLQERIKQTAEAIVPLALLPLTTLDIGRYPVVFDGSAFGALAGRTLGNALELDRVLGYETDASGTSYLAPPEERIGTAVSTPLLSITAYRDMPSASAVKWDDEGVPVHPFPVIHEGRLANYFTSRQTAPALHRTYERRGIPLRSNGCAVATEASDPILTRVPDLAVSAEKSSISLEDLYGHIPRGIFVWRADRIDMDHQLASGSLFASPNVDMFEIERGKLVGRIRGNALQFGTARLWKSLAAIGDTSTIRNSHFDASKGYPWRFAVQTASAPAALFNEINVVSSLASL